jgi:hypothetical protein
MEDPDYEAVLRPLVDGRRVILAGGPVAAFTATAGLVRRLGADAVLVVGSEGRGVGPPPEPDVAAWVAVDVPPSASVVDVVRAGNRMLRDPAAVVRDAVEQFDPTGAALVIGSFLNENPDLLGRPFLAYRRPEWLALDDKTVIDALWDEIGVERAPSAVVAVESDAADRASAALDAGAGTVWAADASQGWHGGAEGLRWVRRPADVDGAKRAFAGRAQHVRIMPFLEGVPCSIHGIVYPDQVIAVRPVEQISLRRTEAPTFFYAGCATFYDPPAAITRAMRAMARRVGEHLRSSVAFRGAFTIDGVVGTDGFLPTELNPRSGAGLVTILRTQPTLPLQLLLDALVGDQDLSYDPLRLEATLVAGADAQRSGGTWRLLPATTVARAGEPVVGGPDGWRWPVDGERPTGSLTTGPSSVGSFVRLDALADQTPRGPSFAPAAAAFWAFADRELGTGVGGLEPATAPVPRS